jgi:hypothetical protein
MRPPQGPTARPKPKSKTPSERAEELAAVQRQLKQQAAERRQANEKKGAKRPAVALSSQARGRSSGIRRTP